MYINLDSMSVSRIEETDSQDYHVHAVPSQEPSLCRHCLASVFYGHGSKPTLIMDTPMHGRRVGILLDRKHYKCRECGKTFLQNCDDIDDKHRATKRLVQYVESNGLVRTFTGIAGDVGITESTVRAIIGDYIASLEDQFQFEPPEILGIDEAHINRKMRLVFTNIYLRAQGRKHPD